MRQKIEDIGDIFTVEGKKKLRKGQLLVFKQDGQNHTYKIISLAGSSVMVREIIAMTDAEMQAHDGHEIDPSNKAIQKYGGPFCITCQVIIGKEITPEDLP